MHKLPKRFLLLLTILTAFQLFLISPVSAANPQDIFYNRTVDQLIYQENTAYDKAKTEGSSQVFDLSVSQSDWPVKFYSLASNIGCINQKLCQQKSTAMGTVAYAIGSIYAHPPASGIYYAYDLMENSGILAKPAYAQGLGFAGLSPLLPLWKVTRNIAYSAIILVMIVIGFMIIFRAKIDPKTVISVQAALPKIIFTLILITLSYPIAGFMVDLMYLAMGILIGMLAQGFGQTARTAQFQTYFLTADFGDLFKTIFSGGFSTLDDFFKRNLTVYLGGNSAVTVVAAILGAQWWSLAIGAGAIGALFILILFLGLLFTFIRILLLLLNSYIQLLIAVILAPLQLLFEAIPGRSAFSGWILNILANIVVFPVTVAILMFAEYLTQMNVNTSNLFAPPFIGFPGTTSVPGFGAFPAFLGLGVLFLAPTLIATVKKQFHPKPMLPVTAGTALAPITGGAQTAMGAASQFYYLKQTLQGLPFLGGGGGHKQS